MRAEKQQLSRKVNIQARAQNFNFKLKATQILPTGNFHRFSLLLRLHKLILKLQLKSGSTVSVSIQQKRTLKSTFFRLLEKLRIRPANKALTIQHPDVKSVLNRLKQFDHKKSICGGLLVVAILALLLQSIYKKDRKGTIIHTSIIFMYSILYFLRYVRKGKSISFWMVLFVGTSGCLVALHLGEGYISEYAWNWRAWSYAAYSGCWYAAFQVIFALVKIFFSHVY
ncbi:hypothetical protein DITRI_Ditri15bG0005400 [Diplodiscus trichospermus]